MEDFLHYPKYYLTNVINFTWVGLIYVFILNENEIQQNHMHIKWFTKFYMCVRVRSRCYLWANPMIYNLAPIRLECTLSTMEWNNPSSWHNCCRDYGINCQVSSYQFFGTCYLRQLFIEPLLSNVIQRYILILHWKTLHDYNWFYLYYWIRMTISLSTF